MTTVVSDFSLTLTVTCYGDGQLQPALQPSQCQWLAETHSVMTTLVENQEIQVRSYAEFLFFKKRTFFKKKKGKQQQHIYIVWDVTYKSILVFDIGCLLSVV